MLLMLIMGTRYCCSLMVTKGAVTVQNCEELHNYGHMSVAGVACRGRKEWRRNRRRRRGKREKGRNGGRQEEAGGGSGSMVVVVVARAVFVIRARGGGGDVSVLRV